MAALLTQRLILLYFGLLFRQVPDFLFGFFDHFSSAGGNRPKKNVSKGFQQDSCPNIIKKEYLKKRYNFHGFSQTPVIFKGFILYIWGQYFAKVADPDS